tara:strand:+ start:2071 stop:2631 length:561 start_codon:yes stop_codon:yes gene_type:complete
MINTWYLLVFVFLFVLAVTFGKTINSTDKESFISGDEQLLVSYDQIFPLDHPKYVTPQQKDFQIVLSEHSALDPNMQNRRPDIKTQGCALGSHCFNTNEWHALNYINKSAPDVINSQMKIKDREAPPLIYTNINSEKVVPSNSVAREMRADLFTDIIIPDLFFRQKRVKRKQDPHPNERNYATKIF